MDTPNFGRTRVAVAPDPATTGTTFEIDDDEVDLYVDVATPFQAIVYPRNAVPSRYNAEIVTVIDVVGALWTVEREAEDSIARAIRAGDRIHTGATKKAWDDVAAALAAMQEQLDDVDSEGDIDASRITGVLADGNIPSAVARDAEVDTKDAAEAAARITGDTNEAAVRLAADNAHAMLTEDVHGISDTGLIVVTSDSRLSNARTPTAHAASHQDGGFDELTLHPSQVVGGVLLDALIPSTITRDTELQQAISDLQALLEQTINDTIDAVVDGAPGAMNTLLEISAALGDDPDFVGTIMAAIATRVPSTRMVNGKALTVDITVTKGDVGLGNVDNIADSAKTFAEAQITGLAGALASKIAASLYDANSILKADVDNTPVALPVTEGTLLGRVAGGSIDALSPSAVRTLLSLVIGTNVQAYSSVLSTLSGASANGQSLVTAADYSAMRTLLSLVPGTHVAALASPAFTGNPTVPTQSAEDNSTKAASTAYVDGHDGWRTPAVTTWNCTVVTLNQNAQWMGSYTLTCATDLRTTLRPGDRIKLTHSSATKYFIVGYTAWSGSVFTMEVHANNISRLSAQGELTTGTANITNLRYSREKNPVGFPSVSQIDWRSYVINATNQGVSNPVNGTFYNALSITTPPGQWELWTQFELQGQTASGQVVWIRGGLATATATNPGVTTVAADQYESIGGLTTGLLLIDMVRVRSWNAPASALTWYLNIGVLVPSISNLAFRGDLQLTWMGYDCALL